MKLLRSYHGKLDLLFTYSMIAAVKSTFTPVTSHHNGGRGRNAFKNETLGSSILTKGADFGSNIRRVMFKTGILSFDLNLIFQCSVPLRIR